MFTDQEIAKAFKRYSEGIAAEVGQPYEATKESRATAWTCQCGRDNIDYFLPGQRSFSALCECGARRWVTR